MTECQHCKSKVVTVGLNTGQQIRCANCLTIWTFGKVETDATDRLAWRSFWLGLSSILFLFFTGIPAIYYGVRSLLRMRFVKPKKRDRAAAIAGTTMGGCFGIFVSFFVFLLAIIGLIAYLTYTATEVGSEVAEQSSQFFETDFPGNIKPVKATSVFHSQHMFDFADHEEVDKRKARFHLLHLGARLQANKDRFVNILKGKSLNSDSLGEQTHSTVFDWEMNGEPVKVRKIVYLPTANDTMDDTPTEKNQPVETHQYLAYLHGVDGYYGLVVVFEPENFELNESQVRKIFATTHIVGSRPRSSETSPLDNE